MTNQTLEMEQSMAGSKNHDIALTATVSGSTITINGEGGADLGKNSGAHRFNFILTPPQDVDVQFASLDTQDSCSTCPPNPGDNSGQIVGMHIAPDGHSAAFTDNNNNKDGPMDVAYQWNFTCSNPNLQVEPFDPIIRNGGTTGP